MEDLRLCPKCGGEMEEGFIADMMHGGFSQSKWTPGEPEFQRIFGFKTVIVKLKGKNLYPVRVLCCADCGFLESYAVREKSEGIKPIKKIGPSLKSKEPESGWDTFPWTPE